MVLVKKNKRKVLKPVKRIKTKSSVSLNRNRFRYKGKVYRIAQQNYLTRRVSKQKISQVLTRVVSDKPLRFDKNGMLMPIAEEVTNDMVSLSAVGEWEKFARMFFFNKRFRVIKIRTTGLVGPAFLAGNRILVGGEVLGLVPKEAIIDEKRYGWQPAEPSFDYGVDLYTDPYSKSLYQRMVVNKTRGFKPKEI